MRPTFTTTRGALSLGAAIIIAGALIAVALIYIHSPDKGSKAANNTTPDGYAIPELTGMLPVTASDHILGNPNAPIKLVEYSDLSCPYCKLFNPTMERIMNEYGPGGKVAWVYRQLPLLSVYDSKPTGLDQHPNSGTQAEALECVAALGGNNAAFSFINKWFSAFPEDGANRDAATDKAQLAAIAKEVGLNASSFNDCLSSRRFKDRVEQEFNEGLASGVTGTPYTFIITPSGSKLPLSGDQDYQTLKNTIDTLISTIDTSATPK